MKKLISWLVVLAMLMVISPAVLAEDAVGSIGNKAELQIGENTAYVAANPDGAPESDYYFTWTATAAGTLTIAFSEEDAGVPFCQPFVNGQPTEEVIGEVGGSMSVDVEANDVVWLQVGEYEYAEATFTFTVSFEPDAVWEGSGTEADPWVVTSLEAPISAVFATDAAADEGAYFIYTATEAGTLTMTEWLGLPFIYRGGFWDTMVDGAENGFAVEANETIYICISGYAAGEYHVTFTFEAGEGGESGSEEPGGDLPGGEPGVGVTDLSEGNNTVEIPEMGNFTDSFIASADGTLTLTVTEMMVYDVDQGEMVDIDPAMMFGRMGMYDLMIDDADVGSHTFTMEVVEGQEIVITLNSRGSEALLNLELTLETAQQGGGSNDTPASGTVDVTATTPIIYEVTPDLDGQLTIVVSSTTGWEVHIADTDGDFDSRYDSSWYTSDTITEDLISGDTYTITIYAYDNVTWEYIDGTITYDIIFEGMTGEPPVLEGELTLGENTLVTGGEYGTPAEEEYTFTAQQDGELFISVMSYFIGDPEYASDVKDMIYELSLQYSYVLVNGEYIEELNTVIDVTAGEVITFKMVSMDGNLYTVNLNLSYEGFYEAPAGSEENPIELPYADCNGQSYYTPEIAPGQTMWFAVDADFYGATLNVYGDTAIVIMMVWGPWGEEPYYYEPVNGVTTLTMYGETFAIMNIADVAMSFEVTADKPLGSETNPDQLPVGDSVEIELAEGNNGYYFVWTADGDGLLTVTVDGVNWMFYVSNETTYDDSGYLYDCYGNSNVGSVIVSAGDQILVKVTTQDSDFNTPAAVLTVSATFGTEIPVCNHENGTDTYKDYESGNVMEYCVDCEEVLFVHVPGTELNPLEINFEWNEEVTLGTVTVTVPAGQTVWFSSYGVSGALLSINGEEYGILTGQSRYMPSVFPVTNSGAEDAEFVLTLTWPVGTANNPDTLIPGEAETLELPEGNSGYYYEWVAEGIGFITITVDGSDNWQFNVNGASLAAEEMNGNSYTLFVTPGDEVRVTVSTLAAAWGEPAPAATLNVTASYVDATAVALQLGDNAMEYGLYSFTATEAGTLYYCFTTLSTEYGDLSDSIRDYFGGDVLLFVNGVEAEEGYFGFMEVAVGDVITFVFKSTNSYTTYSGTMNLSFEDNNPVLGSQERPVHLEYADCPTETVVVAPGEGNEAWYELANGFNGMNNTLTVKGENAYILIAFYDYFGGGYYFERYDAVEGEVTISTNGVGRILIGNAGTEAATFEIEAYIPEGSQGNPADLQMGENVADIEENRSEMFFFQWTAPNDGILTIILSGENWMAYIEDPETWESSETIFYYNDPLVDTVSFQVKAGQVINVLVCTCVDWNNVDWSDPNAGNLPACQIFVNASFECTEHGETYTDYDFCYGEDSPLFDLVEKCVHCDAEIARHLPGTELNPILVDFQWNENGTQATATVTVPAGQTLYFGQYRISGMILTVNGVECAIVDGGWMFPSTFTITNEGAEDATYELTLSYPAGHQMNPDVLAEGETVLDLAEGNSGYFYHWVAEEDGVLTVMISGDTWMYCVHNLTTATYGENLFFYDDPAVTQYSVEVKAGDVIEVLVTTIDPNYGPNPAGQITLNVVFESDAADTGDASIFMALASVLVSGMSIIALPKKKEN